MTWPEVAAACRMEALGYMEGLRAVAAGVVLVVCMLGLWAWSRDIINRRRGKRLAGRR